MDGVRRTGPGSPNTPHPFISKERAGGADYPVIKLRRTIGTNRRLEMIDQLAHLLIESPQSDDFVATITKALGWKVTQIGTVREVKRLDPDLTPTEKLKQEESPYLVYEVPVFGGEGQKASLAIVMTKEGQQMAMAHLINELKIAADLERSGVLPKNYGLFKIIFDEQWEGSVPIFIREYLDGQTFNQLSQGQALTERHIIAMGAVFGKLLPLTERILPINVRPDHLILKETAGEISARFCNVQDLARGVGLLGYLRHGLRAKLFEIGLTKPDLIKQFAKGLISVLPQDFLAQISGEVKGELARVEKLQADLKGLKKTAPGEWADKKEEYLRLFLYKALLTKLKT